MFLKLSAAIVLISSSFMLSSQVVINEVSVKPLASATDHWDQSLAHTSAGWGKEFIELYNTSCVSVDIGCWVIASESFGTSTRDGAFRFPAGTMLGPHAFISVGGPGSGASINLSSYIGNAHLDMGDATRWYLDNGDAYVALFNATGTPVDAVFWTVSPGESAKWGTDSDLNQAVSQIPNPAGCSVIASFPLPSAASMTSVVDYGGMSPALGLTIARMQDGGAFVNNATSTPNATNGVFTACPLPVELIGFEANCVSEQVDLSWQTASEVNNDYFEIQHSLDGYVYNTIATINGAGNSTILNSYEYQITEREMLNGYYRLKQVDYDGTVDYSYIKYADCRSEEPYVQIINGHLIVSNVEHVLNCSIFDLAGRLIFSSKAYEDFNSFMPSSFYYVVIETLDGVTNHKVFVR